MDVAIIGTGLDGLLAAHAVTQAGHKPVLYGPEQETWRPTTALGNVVRKEIPGITDHMDCMNVMLRPDSREDYSIDFIEQFGLNYSMKVFGKDFEDYVDKYMLREFFDLFDVEPLMGFDTWKVYAKLTLLYQDSIHFQWVTPRWYTKVKFRHDFDMVINTLEIHKWCNQPNIHVFPCVYYWLVEEAPFGPFRNGEVYLNGDPEIAHYTQANLWNRKVVEYPEAIKPPMTNALRKARPLDKDCDCHETYDFKNIGMAANWNHMWHWHDSYYKTLELLSDEMNKPVQLDLGI